VLETDVNEATGAETTPTPDVVEETPSADVDTTQADAPESGES
jgi:hypothetical protein